jgi:glycosyltransferase involved in cell wall biosynthesis
VRIAIDYTPAVRQRGGIGRFVRSLVDALVEIDHENEYVLFYAHPRGEQPDAPFVRRPNVVERPLGIDEQNLYRLWFRFGIPVPIDLFTGRVDVFHFPDFVLPPMRSGGSVLTIHDLSFLLHPEHADDGLRQFLERTVPMSANRADFVTVDSANTLNEVICLLDVPPERTAVVYPAVGSEFRPVDDQEFLGSIRHKYGLHYPFILNVGVIEPRKNLVRLLDAYARLRNELDLPHRLCIAGGLGWKYEDVFSKAEELDLGDAVMFLGFVPDEDLVGLYNLADLMVYPSIYEGFGIPPLEAMACGTPVVTSNASSLPEVVGAAGLMASPTNIEALSDAMAQVLGNRVLHDDLAKRGLEQAKLFTWRASAEKLLSIYEKVAQSATASARS